jgi:hypothetical protein
MDTKEELIEMIFQNEYDYHSLPHYGLIPDWYLRYWELHQLVMKHFSVDDYYSGPDLSDK